MMKRLLWSLCAVCTIVVLCLVVSCEKPLLSVDESDEDPDGNLTVSVFQIEKTPFGSVTRAADGAVNRAAKPASEACTRLNYAIYTLDGTRVRQVNQVSTDANFGTTTFKLEAGEYQLVVVGHSSNGNPTMTDPKKIKFENANGFTDTYIYYETITIGEENVEKPVALNRITSLCRFVLTDESIPAEVKKLQFSYTGGSGAFDAATGYGSVKSTQKMTFVVSASQKQFDLYTFPYQGIESTLHLTVTALDASDGIYAERTFDVPMQQNYITWVSGVFFNGSGTSTTTITGVTVNTDWAGETHITF